MVLLGRMLFGVASAVCLAGQDLAVRLASRRGLTVDVLLVVLLMNTIILVLLAVLVTSDPVLTLKALLAFVAAGLVGTVLGRGLFYSGIKRVGASRAEPIKASMQLHATILAAVISVRP